MSEVISFRLNNNNPRETQARGVIKAWVKRGYSLRSVITEALLRLGDEPETVFTSRKDNIIEAVDKLTNLIDRLEFRTVQIPSIPSQIEPELNTSFLAAIKKTAKPGLRSEI